MGVAEEREHVDGFAQVLHLLLVPHAETLLLVDDDKAEIARVTSRDSKRCVPTKTETVPSGQTP